MIVTRFTLSTLAATRIIRSMNNESELHEQYAFPIGEHGSW